MTMPSEEAVLKYTDMKTKKSQMQMGENVIIIFIFFILLIFAVVFFMKIQGAKTKQRIDIDITGRGLQIAQKVAFLPEVQCTKDNAEIFSGCYDEFSIRALDAISGTKAQRDYYYDVFGFSTVSVRKIFPIDIEQKPLVLYNNTLGNYTSIIVSNVPISLCNFLEDRRCSFGVLKVEVYT
ncbi:MAG: hypothetical protein AABW88_02475 [Nanoarchaeota archaeon]